MKENIFRKESLERINSAGQLNRYIRVADPGTWLILAAVVVLLLGAIAWGFFGTLETGAAAFVVADDGAALCYLSLQDAAKLQPGMEVRAGDWSGEIAAVSTQAVPAPDGVKAYLGLEICAAAQAKIEALPDGIYDAEIIVESIAPISFVIR